MVCGKGALTSLAARARPLITPSAARPQCGFERFDAPSWTSPRKRATLEMVTGSSSVEVEEQNQVNRNTALKASAMELCEYVRAIEKKKKVLSIRLGS